MSSKTIDYNVISAALLGVALSVGACTSEGPVDNPFLRSAQWRAYVAASDLKSACRPGTPEAMRLVFNGDYKEEIRSYDIRASADGTMLEARRRGSTNLLSMDLLDPLGLWRGEKRVQSIDPATYGRIKTALIQSGFRDSQDDERLKSDTFYWVASACFDGAFRTQVWAWPSDRYERIRFDRVLVAIDGFDKPLREPRPPRAQFADERRENPPFEIRFRGGQLY
jgi:hypothetical protein